MITETFSLHYTIVNRTVKNLFTKSKNRIDIKQLANSMKKNYGCVLTALYIITTKFHVQVRMLKKVP